MDNPALPTVWVDTASIFVRSDPAVVMIRFYTSTATALLEACRIQTAESHVRSLIDAMSKAINHYPKPEDETE